MRDYTEVFANETIEELRGKAHEDVMAKEDSYDRCDTDGFRSQMAFDTMAGVRLRVAEVKENGGVWDFPALVVEETGEILATSPTETRFGRSWRLTDEQVERFGRKWIPVDDSHDMAGAKRQLGKATRSRVQKNLGLVQVLTPQPAGVVITGSLAKYGAIVRKENIW